MVTTQQREQEKETGPLCGFHCVLPTCPATLPVASPPYPEALILAQAIRLVWVRRA